MSNINVTFTVNTSIIRNEDEEKFNKLFREVTEKKDSGNMDEAIELLSKTYKDISKTDLIYPIDTFLRLPLYLQQVKRTDEAWEEFNNLLKNGYPNQKDKKSDRGKIYDKMRLFLQREKRMDEAIAYGLAYYIYTVACSYTGMKRAEENFKIVDRDNFSLMSEKEFKEYREFMEEGLYNGKKQFETLTSKEKYTEEAKKLLKKAKKLDKIDDICSLIENHLIYIPDVKDEEFIKEVNKIL
jgi:hypothetical protein